MPGRDRETLRVDSMEERSRAAFFAARFLSLRSDVAEWSEEFAGSHVVADDTRAQLHAAVARYTTLLRELGEPPERVLVRVKAFAAEISGWCDIDDREARAGLSTQFVKWAIDAYYAGNDAPRGLRG